MSDILQNAGTGVNLSFNVQSLYRSAFPDLASKALVRADGARDLGLRQLDAALGDGFRPGYGGQRSELALDFEGIDTKLIVQGDAMSYLGTPIFQPITFLGGVYQQLGTGPQAGQVVDAPYVGWALPATTTAEFARAKEITKSRPSTATGTTKEMWAFDDWDITIRGLILDGQPNYFPQAVLRELLSWEKIVDSIDVSGDMFTYLGIKRLIIEKVSIGKVAGSPNVVPFQLSCASDEPLELSILSNSIGQ
jgi:hypothetical protein